MMSFFSEVLTGIASEFVSGFRDGLAVNGANGVIDTFCRELGWEIDERYNQGRVGLYFKDSVIGRRTVRVSIVGGGAMVSFTVGSAVSMPAKEIPVEILGHLLERNSELVGGWFVSVDDDDDTACFAVNYCALSSGLNAAVFKLTCETLLEEANDFDDKMRQAGVLRVR